MKVLEARETYVCEIMVAMVHGTYFNKTNLSMFLGIICGLTTRSGPMMARENGQGVKNEDNTAIG